MGLLSNSLYALFRNNIISVHGRTDLKSGQIESELRLNGLLVDYHKDDSFIPKEGSLSGTITRADGSKTSVQVNLKTSWIKSISYTLLIDDTEVPLIKSTEAKIKEKIKNYGYDFTEISKLPTNLLKEIKAQLMKDEDKKQAWTQGCMFLAIIWGFFAVGFDNIPRALIILIGVLFIHELGHLIGMKIFGYTDLKMFFISFFGRAVHGKKMDVPRHHKAIVSLMGPIPGLGLALMLIGVYIVTEAPIILEIVGMLLIVNALNLLPLKPFDGGRFLKEILFYRNIFLETWLSLIASLLLILGGLAMGDYILITIGVYMGVFLPTEFNITSIASEIRKDGINGTKLARELGESDLSRILEQIKSLSPRGIKPEHYADILRVIIEQSKKPPSIGVTIILLFIYLLFLCLSLLTAVLFLILS